MDRDTFVRRALLVSVFFNIFGALVFAFPGSFLGEIAGLPAAVPTLYRGTVVLFVLLFAGMYAWLAGQPQIDRPMVAFAAIGKSAFFGLMTVFWLFGVATPRGVMTAGGDLVFAAIFAWWVIGSSPTPALGR